MFVIVKSLEHKIDANGNRFLGRDEAVLTDAFLAVEALSFRSLFKNA